VTITGGCLCGAVRFAASSSPTFVCICHCQSCRRATGAPAVPWATFRVQDVQFIKGAPTLHGSSPGVTRGHCAICGSSICYRHERRPDDIDLTVACLDDAAAFRPVAHIWLRDKLPWIVINDDLPQYQATVTGG
jgi:hypothetical protein